MNNNSYDNYENRWNYTSYNSSPTQSGPTPPIKKKPGKGFKIFAIIASIALIMSLTIVATMVVMNVIQPHVVEKTIFSSNKPLLKPSTEKTVTTTEKPTEPGIPLTNQEIIAKGEPSVVGIIVDSDVSSFGRTFNQQSIGSGFIVTTDGYIITNSHVVENATKITVIMKDAKEYEAKLIGEDTLSDVAVVKIEGNNFPAVELGNSDSIVKGDPVIAIGTPAGIQYAGTATHGMISAINRDVKITDYYGNTTKTMTVIQIDASINSGNSGGPLFDQYGRVIGITSLKLGNGFEGMGFALPINGVINIANELMEKGKIIERPEGDFVTGKAYLGIEFYEVSQEQAKYYNIPEGVLIYQLTPGGAAQNAGICRGDIIVKFNDSDIKNSSDLTKAIEDLKPGVKVTVKVDRNGEKIDFEVTMGYQS